MKSAIRRSGSHTRFKAAASHVSDSQSAPRRSQQPIADKSAHAGRAAQLRRAIDTSARVVAQRQQFERFAGGIAQRQPLEDDELQMKAEGPIQAQAMEEEELLQGKFTASTPAQLKDIPDAPPNDSGLPDRLKAGVERLSGLSMDDVRVHRNSARPAGLQALAYTQGSDIHVAPGQDHHLAHEAWHVVQQKEGRVQPDMQMKGVDINADPILEHEADVMGAKAASAEKAPRR
jgi:hypothetical protein